MFKFNHYRTALYLCAAIGVTEAIWFLVFIIPRTPQHTRVIVITLATTFIIGLGLLVQSNLIRYVGAVLMAAWGGGLLWGVSRGIAPLSQPTPIYLLVFFYYLLLGALHLLTAAILIFSKQFANEFAKRRDSQPKYVRNLRRLLVGAIVGAVLIATFNDIVKLASTP
jgi:hypothetical protein